MAAHPSAIYEFMQTGHTGTKSLLIHGFSAGDVKQDELQATNVLIDLRNQYEGKGYAIWMFRWNIQGGYVPY